MIAALAAATILGVPFEPKGDAPPASGVALAESILDVVVQGKIDNFLTLKQLDAVLRRRDLRLTDADIPATPSSWRARWARATSSPARSGSTAASGSSTPAGSRSPTAASQARPRPRAPAQRSPASRRRRPPIFCAASFRQPSPPTPPPPPPLPSPP